MRRIGNQLLTVALCMSLTGCSFLFTKGGEPPRCSTGNGGPVWDSVFGALSIGNTALAASNDNSDYDGSELNKESHLLLALGFSALFISSAIHGFRKTASCRRAGGGREPRDRRTMRPHPPLAVRADRSAVRSSFQIGDWDVSLLGVPSADRDRVAIRIESRSLTQRFKRCRALESIVDGVATTHAGRYDASILGGKVREVVLVRVPIDTIAAIGKSTVATLALCGPHRVVPPAAVTEIARFVQAFLARAAAPQPQPQPQPQPRVPEVRLALVLEGQPIDLLGQPTLYDDYAFLLLPSVAPGTPGCDTFGISIDRVATSLPLLARPGVAGASYTTIDVSLLRKLAAGSDVSLSVCNVARPLSAEDRAAIGTFTASYPQPAATTPAATTPSPQPPK